MVRIECWTLPPHNQSRTTTNPKPLSPDCFCDGLKMLLKICILSGKRLSQTQGERAQSSTLSPGGEHLVQILFYINKDPFSGKTIARLLTGRDIWCWYKMPLSHRKQVGVTGVASESPFTKIFFFPLANLEQATLLWTMFFYFFFCNNIFST